LQDDIKNLLRRARGSCPKEAVLRNYAGGRLEPGVKDALRPHIELCGVCQGRLKRIRDIDRAFSEPAQDCVGWNTAGMRLRRRIRDMISDKRGHPRS
jgi:hypothetical protein